MRIYIPVRQLWRGKGMQSVEGTQVCMCGKPPPFAPPGAESQRISVEGFLTGDPIKASLIDRYEYSDMHEHLN